MFKNLNLQVKIMALPMIVAGFLLATGLIVSRRLSVIKSNVTHITDSLATEANDISQLLQNILETDAVVEKYLKTGDEESLVRFSELRKQYDLVLNRSQTKMTDPERISILEEMIPRDSEYSEVFAERVVRNTQIVIFKAAELLNQLGPLINKTLTDIIETAFRDDRGEVANAGADTLKHF